MARLSELNEAKTDCEKNIFRNGIQRERPDIAIEKERQLAEIEIEGKRKQYGL